MRFTKWKSFPYFFLRCSSIFILVACTQTETSDQKTSIASQANSSDFVQIYDRILSVSCGLGGCHDGSFEPNYTSINAAYYTMVWHPLKKNNKNETFQFRVVPFDVAKSVFYERVTNCCFVDKNDRMPFADKKGLDDSQLRLIKKWINEGAKDMFGNIPEKICILPSITNIRIIAKDVNGKKIDKLEKFTNILGEKVSTILPSTLDTVQVLIQTSPDPYFNCSPNITKSYFVQLYKDVTYSDTLFSSIPLKRTNKADIFIASIQKSYLKTDTLFFLRVETDSPEKYSFPSMQTSSEIRYKWAFIWK